MYTNIVLRTLLFGPISVHDTESSDAYSQELAYRNARAKPFK